MEYSVFDTHCDTLCKILDNDAEFVKNDFELDVQRMRCYKEYTQVMACFISPKHRKCAKKRTIDLINTYHNITKNLKDIKTILSIEGADGIKSLSDLDLFYKLGVKLIGLTWNYSNHIAAGAHERDRERGLTEFGRKLVKKMDDLKIFTDVSHLNDKSFFDVAQISKMPLIASHSSSRAVCNHCRNITDEMFNIIKQSRGCVGINIYPVFLTNSEFAVVDDVVRHIEHFMSLGGENHIGIGSDFDGTDGILPQGIYGCQDLYKIFDRLLQLNYTEEQVDKISCKNFKSIFENVDKIC